MSHDGTLEKCDLDLVKLLNRSTTKLKKLTIWRNFIERDTFNWSSGQEESFQIIKDAIINNKVTKVDLNL